MTDLTQQELADKFNVTRQTVARWQAAGVLDDKLSELTAQVVGIPGTGDSVGVIQMLDTYWKQSGNCCPSHIYL